jgi:hypothetical protein
MKRSIRLPHVLAAGILAATATVAPLARAVHAEPEGPDEPAEIAVPDGNKEFLVGHASGVQIYSCNATSSGFEWALVAPRAELYDDKGRSVAIHFGGPTWQARDGSTVVGRRKDGVTVDETAIPWLLLSRVSTTIGPDGDRLTNTTYIQRTATTGGLAPSSGDCDAMTTGNTVDVPYTADYHFWKATGG